MVTGNVFFNLLIGFFKSPIKIHKNSKLININVHNLTFSYTVKSASFNMGNNGFLGVIGANNCFLISV